MTYYEKYLEKKGYENVRGNYWSNGIVEVVIHKAHGQYGMIIRHNGHQTVENKVTGILTKTEVLRILKKDLEREVVHMTEHIAKLPREARLKLAGMTEEEYQKYKEEHMSNFATEIKGEWRNNKCQVNIKDS